MRQKYKIKNNIEQLYSNLLIVHKYKTFSNILDFNKSINFILMNNLLKGNVLDFKRSRNICLLILCFKLCSSINIFLLFLIIKPQIQVSKTILHLLLSGEKQEGFSLPSSLMGFHFSPPSLAT